MIDPRFLHKEERKTQMRSQKQNKGFTLIELMIVVTIIGILAMVAGPELMKYQAKAKTTEATQNVSKIADGARAYYLAEQTTRAGVLLPKQFPTPFGPTPAKPGCDGTSPKKYNPSDYSNAADFGSSSWQALQFSVSKPFLYAYQFDANGTGSTARFTARALGDLDCDGLLSTYEQPGSVDTNNQVVMLQIYQEQPLE